MIQPATLRAATTDDLASIKRIVNQGRNREGFGFVSRVVHEAAIASQQQEGSKDLMLVAARGDDVLGFMRAYHRNDGNTTLHEIAVNQGWHGQGIGRLMFARLVESARARGQQGLQVRTPAAIAANNWYVSLGFNLVAREPGRKRPLNFYRLQLA